MYGQYQLYSVGHEAAVSSSYASIANRVSYFFNFSGPSIALDTMCSSSLTAVHFACESLIRNECEFAIAGGVNLSIHPHKYELLTQGGFLSSDGRCRSFGSGGDGYVPGEGTGAVLLKPVKRLLPTVIRFIQLLRQQRSTTVLRRMDIPCRIQKLKVRSLREP